MTFGNFIWLSGSFLAMEGLSWAIHKYLLHGVLWHIHRTHHRKNNTWLEWNDLVSLTFAAGAVVLIVPGVNDLDYRFWMGMGISLYGMLYFILHDVLIHRRLRWFEQSRNRYLKAITQAHRMHHRHSHRLPSESYGLLWVNKRFFRQDKQAPEEITAE
jgi:beta-carotene 3-hydroxylase